MTKYHSTKYNNKTTIECNETPTEDYRGDQNHCTGLLAQSYLTTKEQPIVSPVDQDESALDDQPSAQSPKEDVHSSTKKPIFPDDFPASLNSIK